MIIENPNGITVKDLKDLIDRFPLYDEYGDPFEVWIYNGDGTSSVCTKVSRLNKFDILLEK